MSEKLYNDITWVLASGINNSATSLTVSSYGGTSAVTSFPSSGTGKSIRLRIDDEILILTAWSTTTFTVTRGAEGSTAASHSAAAVIECLLTAGAVESRLADQCLSGVHASKPAAGSSSGTPGRLYLPTDGFNLQRDSGGSEADSWHPFGPVFPQTPPPALGTWTQLNVSGNTGAPVVDALGGSLGLYDFAGAGGTTERLAVIHRAMPSTPFTLTAQVLIGANPGPISRSCGLCFVDAATSKVASLCLSFAGSSPSLNGYVWTNPTTYSGTNLGPNAPCDLGQARFLRMVHTGSVLEGWCSGDGVAFFKAWTQSVGTNITPTDVGFFINAAQAAYGLSIRILSWST